MIDVLVRSSSGWPGSLRSGWSFPPGARARGRPVPGGLALGQACGKTLRGLWTIVRVLGEAREHERLERSGDRRSHPLGRGDGGRLDVVEQDLDGSAADEHALSRQQPVGDAPQPVDVDPGVQGLPPENGFGCHEGRGPGDDTVGGQVVIVAHAPDRLDEAEVHDLDEVPLEAPVAGDHVRGLDVPVDEADGVRLGERVASLDQDVDGALRRHRPEAPHEGFEVEALQQLHHVVEGPLRSHAEVVERHRVGGVEGSGGLRLALEAADEGRGLDRRLDPEQLGPDQLDRHRPGEHAVPRPPDLAHAAVVQLLHELVAPQFLEPPDHDRREHGQRRGEVVRETGQERGSSRRPAGCRARGRSGTRAATSTPTRARRRAPTAGRRGRRAGRSRSRRRARRPSRGAPRSEGLEVVPNGDGEGYGDLVAEAHSQEPDRGETPGVGEPHHGRRRRHHGRGDHVHECQVREGVPAEGFDEVVEDDSDGEPEAQTRAACRSRRADWRSSSTGMAQAGATTPVSTGSSARRRADPVTVGPGGPPRGWRASSPRPPAADPATAGRPSRGPPRRKPRAGAFRTVDRFLADESHRSLP